MKKILALILVLAMIAVMAVGCGNGSGSTEPTKNTENTQNTEGTEPEGTEPEGTEPEQTDAPTEGSDSALSGDLLEIIGKIYEEQPVDYMLENITLDLTDTSDDAKWMVKSFAGLEDVSDVSEIATSAANGSTPYTLTLVRVKDAANAKAVAERMKEGVDPRKWVCVWTDTMLVAGYGDVVILAMTNSEHDVSAQQLVDAFQKVCGAELDFVEEIPFEMQGGGLGGGLVIPGL